MSYKVAGVDIHKKVLMVVVATAGDEVTDPAGEAIEFECRRFGAGARERTHMIIWLRERNVSEVVMESTAQYLETGVAGSGAAFWETASGPGALQSGAEGPQKRLS